MAQDMSFDDFFETMDDIELQGILRKEIDDAVDYVDNWVSPIRSQATKYYRGEPFGDEEPGRSQVVSMDVRDTTQAIMPSLMRIFHGNEKTVQYVPQGPEDVPMAKLATEYVNYIVNRDNNGFLVTHAAFQDALVRKVGIIKAYWDDRTEFETHNFSGLDDEALAKLMADDSVEVNVLQSETFGEPSIDEMGQMVMPPQVHAVQATYSRPNGRVKIEAVPPEEFLISRESKSIAEADYVAHRRVVTISELVQMGYDAEQFEDIGSIYDDMEMNVERTTRNPALQNEMNQRDDDAMRKLLYVESYIRVDYDQDGIAELRKVCTVGNSNEIIMNEPVDIAPFCSFCPDPEAHDFFGMSVADSVMDIQRIKSVIMRNTLDSLAMSIHPRIAVTEGMVNIEDVMNTEVGSIIRQRSAGQVQPLSMPFVGQQAFPVLQYMDEIREQRTGISKASQGLDSAALQSTTASAVNATVTQAQQRIELIARIFAETGMKDLYSMILKLIVKHQDQPRMVRFNEDFQEIDPRAWNANMDVSVNVALGRGTDQDRMAMLMQLGNMQKEALQQMGPSNPITDISKLTNTMREFANLAGYKDASMFFNDPETYQAPPQPPEKPDINEQLIAVQIQEIQANMQKKAAELQIEQERIRMEDDRKRDELDAELFMKAAEMQAKFGTQLDVEKIRADMQINREVLKAQSDVIKGSIDD